MKKPLKSQVAPFNTRGDTIPITLNKANLYLKTKNEIIHGEHKIYNIAISKLKIPALSQAKGEYKPARKKTIKTPILSFLAPAIYTANIIPILLIEEMADIIKRSEAKLFT